MSITFIATAYQENIEAYLFISSMLLQTNKNWKLIIYSNGHSENIETAIRHFNDNRIIYLHSEINNGYWGCLNRIDALNNYVDTEFVCQTSIQDYYIPIAVESILKNSVFDFLYWDSTHNHRNWDILNSSLNRKYIDWGNFAIKTHIAKLVGINYPTEFSADWLFVNDCLQKNVIDNRYKIEKILTVHN
jgi:hypothetical protein